jgi:hypothetical protein
MCEISATGPIAYAMRPVARFCPMVATPIVATRMVATRTVDFGSCEQVSYC